LLVALYEDLPTGHDKVQKCKEHSMECYFWLNMDEDILKHSNECFKCQAIKDNHKVDTSLTITPVQLVKTSDMGNNHVLTIIYAFPKYAEIVTIPNKEAKTIANEAFTKWISGKGI
jgi:hypothetical protein